MKVLIACEESQTETIAFRALGYEAYSCDICPCSGGFPEWHIQDDALKLLKYDWDLIVAHPPCTYLSNAGANLLRINGEIQRDRFLKAQEAKAFFMAFYNCNCPKVAIENPIPGSIHGLPAYSQIVQPCMFGDPWLKTTCLWLKHLPLLLATDLVVPEGKWVSTTPHGRCDRPGEWPLRGCRSAKMRSKSFPGMAAAMASQWTGQPFPWML